MWRPTNIHILSILLISFWTRNVSEESCRENQDTDYMFKIFFYSCVYKLRWNNTAERCRLQMTIWCMCISYWIPKATHSHSQYVILIAFPLQQWLHERASILQVHYLSCSILTYILTYSMLQSPSWEANWFAASQETPCISRNPKVHYRTQKRPPPVSILG